MLVLMSLLLVAGGWLGWARWSFPADTVPEGAYLRIVKAVNRGQPEEVFPYTEEEAQHACYTILDYRKRSISRAQGSFPPDRLRELERQYGEVARSTDGREVFALYAREQGWLDQLRSDLSGIERAEVAGPRATVVTARGTRYAFRRRPNGIWGLTAFTPTLKDEAEKSARDWALIEKAAEDYERAAAR